MSEKNLWPGRQVKTAGLGHRERDGGAGDWEGLRETVVRELASLDEKVIPASSGTLARCGSNRGGEVHLFAYRTYAPDAASGIDPVVVGVSVRPADGPSGDHFVVAGDVSGELSGDILFELEPKRVIGWTPMVEATQAASANLARQDQIVVQALSDLSRRE